MHQDPSAFPLPMGMNPQFPEHEHLNCPRCESSNTKFCYYNNYNLSQPRHYCKNCRRYWTKGGTLRNIPVGGGTRKPTKRSSNSGKRPVNSTSPDSPVTTPPPPPPPLPAQFKPEPFPMFGFGNNQSKTNGANFNSFLRSNHGAQFGGFLDSLRSNLGDGAQERVLIGTPTTGVLRNYLGVNNDNNRSGSGGGRGESSGRDGGENGWPNLSISTPGSNFH